jgi:hypothetical protein
MLQTVLLSTDLSPRLSVAAHVAASDHQVIDQKAGNLFRHLLNPVTEPFSNARLGYCVTVE